MNHQNHRLNSRDSEYQVDLMEVTLEKELVKLRINIFGVPES